MDTLALISGATYIVLPPVRANADTNHDKHSQLTKLHSKQSAGRFTRADSYNAARKTDFFGFSRNILITPLDLSIFEAAQAGHWQTAYPAAAGTMVTLSPQPQASVWFGLRKTNFSWSSVVS